MLRAADAHYGAIVVHAFSSDALPLHLMTQEAIALYVRKLAPNGLLLCHISNRYLRLDPVLGSAARDLGLAGLFDTM